MPSNAHQTHLLELLKDADALDDVRSYLGGNTIPSPQQLEALSRAVVVLSVSAWESYVEELVVEAVAAMRPVGGTLGAWSVHAAAMRGQASRFHTPSPDKVKESLSDALGLTDIRPAWVWPGQTAEQSQQELSRTLHLRHQIAHGTNPRPVVQPQFSSGLPQFFRNLGLATDRAVRAHLTQVLGVVHPWPA